MGDVAVRHGSCESLVFTWWRWARGGVLSAPEVPVFVAVRVLASVLTRVEVGLIEIDPGDECGWART